MVTGTGRTRRWTVGFAAALLIGLTPAAALAKTPLVVWDWWGLSTPNLQAWYQWLETEFERRNPDIDVEFQFNEWGQYLDKLLTAVAGGVGPDAAQLSIIWARDLYDQGLLLELNSYIAGAPDAHPSQFVPATQVYNQKNGRIYGLTFVLDSAALAYNKDHFSAAGLDEGPFALATWDDFIEAAKKLTRSDGGQVTRSGFVLWPGLESFTSWLYSNGGAFYNDDLTGSGVRNRSGLETLTLFHDLRLSYNIWGPSATSLPAETASMIHAGTWSGSYFLTENPSLRFGLTSFPQGPSGTGRGTTTWGNMFSIFRGTKVPDAAWRFLRFVTGLEAQIWLLNGMDRPTSPRLAFYRTPAWQAAVEDRPWMTPMPAIATVGGPYAFLRFTEVNVAVQPLLDQVAGGQMSPQEALIKIEEAVNRALAEME